MSKDRDKFSNNKLQSNKLLELISCGWVAQALYVTAELRIADLLENGPRTSEELAETTNTHAPSLHRLLRALTTIDICQENQDGSFAITSMGRLLRTDSPESLHYWTIWWGKHLWQVWGNLLYSIKTGKSARNLLFGTEGFKHLEQDQEAATIFNKAMAELTQLNVEDIVKAYDFSGFQHIVDLGGGNGELLLSILKSCPSTTGILFELPHAIESSKQYTDDAGLSSRYKYIIGDFFKKVPKGADVYILKSVIHDWDNVKGKQILKNCRDAMGDKGKLILIERVLPDSFNHSTEHQALGQIDLTMLVANAAQERTENQFRELLNSAGLDITNIFPTESTFKIIETCSKNKLKETV